MSKRLIQEAKALAYVWHAGQVRAEGSPYIKHPMRVATLVQVGQGRDDMVAAAWLHDIYEDTEMYPPELTERFGPSVSDLVEALTNVYTKESYPRMNRAERTAAEIERLAKVSWPAQFIKLCDRIDNLQTIAAKGRGFAMLYCDESEALVDVLTAAPFLQEIARSCIQDIRDSK